MEVVETTGDDGDEWGRQTLDVTDPKSFLPS